MNSARHPWRPRSDCRTGEVQRLPPAGAPLPRTVAPTADDLAAEELPEVEPLPVAGHWDASVDDYLRGSIEVPPADEHEEAALAEIEAMERRRRDDRPAPTHEEIAARLGLSRQRVQALEQQALDRLWHTLKRRGGWT